ncbi:ABC transporter permease [Acidobacteria bacterium AB60]|nr:ABC transporter permease [Acidobacteria bacterium AB60]
MRGSDKLRMSMHREQSHGAWPSNNWESLSRDVRFGARSLLRSPGFLCLAIGVMSLGIGANTALFAVVRYVLLKPLPYANSDRLATLYEADTHPRTADPHLPTAFGSFTAWQQATSTVAQMAAVSTWQEANLSGEGGKLPERVAAAWCTGNFFSVLGVAPSRGRSFTDQDDRFDAPSTVLITNTLWMRRYNGDPAIVGKVIWLDAKPYTVVGVLPSSFMFYSAQGGNNSMVWLPVRHVAPPSLLTSFNDHWFVAIARLLPGVTLPSLVEQLKAAQKQIQIEHAAESVHDTVLGRSMLDDAIENYKTPLYALLAATACVLLIACLNVAGLLVARAASRRKEVAIRSALGGGGARLVRERLIESLLLSFGGGWLGLLLAWAALHLLVSLRGDMNRIETIHIDGVVAVFTLILAALCSLFSGLIAAFSATGKHLLGSLRESSRAHSGSKTQASLRRLLLVLEVGLTVVLLIGAGLLLKSYERLRTNDIGVPTENVLTMRFSLPKARYTDPPQQVSFFEKLVAQVREQPGVQAAGLVSVAPGEGWGADRAMRVVEHPRVRAKDLPDIQVRGAEPGYFQAIQLPLLRGRIFTTDERFARANKVVLSESAAKILFPGEDPLGKHLQDDHENLVYEVIGIVGDTRWNVNLPPMPTLYSPIYGNGYSAATIVVRSTHTVDALTMPVQKVIGRLDPDLPVSDAMSLQQAMGKSTIASAFDSMLVAAFAMMALLLAVAGLYGVLSYLVTQRSNEICIRMALGAQRSRVLRLMLLDGLRPALFGVVGGLAFSALAVRQIESMLYQTEPLDLFVYTSVTGILLLVAALACLLPAWRASRLDPVQSLRTE